MLLVSAGRKLEARMNMQMGPLNSNEPCVFQRRAIKAEIISPNLLRAALSAAPAPRSTGLAKTALKRRSKARSHTLDWLAGPAENIRLIGCC